MADTEEEKTTLDKVLRFQTGLIAACTQDEGGFDNATYERLRRELLAQSAVSSKLPDFVRRCRDQGQFWQYIKYQHAHYHERRSFIWESFQPLLDYLEADNRSPGIDPVTTTLESFDIESVGAAWKKALDRRFNDPDGAITAARTLLETVCKHLLDEMEVEYANDGELPKLWHLCAEKLNLAPSQHTEVAFKTILGSAQSIVNTLGSLRSKIGDAHGHGRRPVKPKPRHAELAVNLAGTMASFLVATWSERHAPKDRSGT